MGLLAFLAVLSSFAIILSVPLWDIDLWYHLATGRYILEHKTLLSYDPFSYTTGEITPFQTVNLKGYWLAQIIFYSAYAVFGNYGIIVLRVLLLVLALSTIFFIGQRIKASKPILLIFIMLAGFISQHFTGERPQLFSFLLTPIVLYLLNDLKKKYTCQTKITIESFILLPLIMLVWANLHRGFIIGTALIAIFGISEAINLFFKKELNKSFLSACAIMIIAVFASFINPNTYRPYIDVVMFEGSVLQQRISEYTPPIMLGIKYGQFLPAYWIYLLVCLSAFILHFKRIDRTNFIIFAFLMLLSMSAFRYIPFFVYSTSPYAALYLSRVIEGRKKLQITAKALVCMTLLITFIFAYTGFENTLGSALKNPLNERRFPEGAVSFIHKSRPSGRIFNHFNWGGYLIWRLYPDYKVFIDSRTLNLKALSDYTYILWDKNRWKGLLDSYDVKIIIMPGLNNFTGELYELANYLYEDKDWHLVYRDDTALIFLRGQENQNLISRFSLPKTEIYTHAIWQANNLLHTGLNNNHIWNAMYKAYTAKGMIEQAENAKRQLK
ncbi:MAG: hypothetical protein HZB79_10430 [Deltaproteobacteria bacterium]|nr:hypothetical protein [Deltaproteobacteria bacterium]